jgi:hypothetical protein
VIFDVHALHGVVSSEHVVAVTRPMRFPHEPAVVWFVGLAGRFEISTPMVEATDCRSDGPMRRRKATRSAAASRAADRCGHAKGARQEEERHRK